MPPKKKPAPRRRFKKLTLSRATVLRLVRTDMPEVRDALAQAIGTRIQTCDTCWDATLCHNCG